MHVLRQYPRRRRRSELGRVALVQVPEHLVDEAHRSMIQPMLENAAQASASQIQARDSANEAGGSTDAASEYPPVTLRTPPPYASLIALLARVFTNQDTPLLPRE